MKKIKLELVFPEKLKDEAIICDICKKFDIVLNIVGASFSTNTGWAIVILNGKEEELKKTTDYLTAAGVEIDDSEVIPG